MGKVTKEVVSDPRGPKVAPRWVRFTCRFPHKRVKRAKSWQAVDPRLRSQPNAERTAFGDREFDRSSHDLNALHGCVFLLHAASE